MNLRPAVCNDTKTRFEIRCFAVENHRSREVLALPGIAPRHIAEMIAGGGPIG
jgi:hypothetical protein